MAYGRRFRSAYKNFRGRIKRMRRPTKRQKKIFGMSIGMVVILGGLALFMFVPSVKQKVKDMLNM